MSASTRNIIAWILQGLAALAFIGSGANKFVHLADTVKGFSGMGLPGWFAYLIAGGEVLGGIGLLVPDAVLPDILSDGYCRGARLWQGKQRTPR